MSETEGTMPESMNDEVARAQAMMAASEQGLLFDDLTVPSLEELGYRGPVAATVAGITYRQLDYWARTELVVPTVRSTTGSGSARLYGFRDILELKIVKSLLDAGVSLQQIRIAVEYLRSRGFGDITKLTLMSDGVTVYACTSNDEIIDVMAHGQAVFGIAVGNVWQELEGNLSQLPSERAEIETPSNSASDELSIRRRKRQGA